MKTLALHVFENETLYSLITRYYSLSGFLSYSSFLDKIYSSRKARIHPYLPTHLEVISSELDISANKLLANYTLHPLFSLFTDDRGQSLADVMLSENNSGSSTVYLSHFRLPFYKGHKYCPLCAMLDSQKYGCTHWYTQHQVPGISVCPVHYCSLIGVSNQDAGIDRKLVLPPGKISTIKPGTEKEILLAKYVTELLGLLSLTDSKLALSITSMYRARLGQRGLVTPSGQLKYAQIVNELGEYWHGLPYGGLLDVPEKVRSFAFVGPLMRKNTSYATHPIKHLLFTCWLFDANPELFFKNLKTKQSRQALNDKRRDEQKIIELLTVKNSLAEVARISRKSVCYVRRLAELNDIPHVTNSTGYSGKVRNQVRIQAILGCHRATIAKSLSVGIGYVEQVISNTRGLSKLRKHLRQFKKVKAAVNELETACSLHPNWLRKDLKAQHNQAFFYLYHHARQRLMSILPERTKPHLPKYNWSKEDDRLYVAISKLKLANKMSLSAIGRTVGDRDHLRKKIKMLPKTKTLLVEMGVISIKYC